MEQSVNRGRDRISELPDSLIHHILSFLPIRNVVATTLLSKRWKNLWKTVPCLNFFELGEYHRENAEEIRTFVNRALLFWRGVGILKFNLLFKWKRDFPLANDIGVWVHFAVENKVEELNIHLKIDEWLVEATEGIDQFVHWAPLCLSSCSSIRELSLVGCNLRIPVSPPSWNQLKSLKIDGYRFCSESLVNLIMLGSPQLEVFELRFLESNENLNICSTRLRKLKIEKYLLNEYDKPSTDKGLGICCPNLEILAISGVSYSKCLFTNVSSVTDVSLGLNGTYDYGCGNELLEETLKHIFSSFQHVHKATLSYWCVQVLGVLSSSLPNAEFFPNLKMLVIKDHTRDAKYEFDASKYLKFKTKLFDGSKYLKFETKLSKSFMLQLKTVDITLLEHKTSTLQFIEFLLKDACMLEKLVIWVNKRKSYFADEEVAERLLSMPRSSSTARVVLKKYWS